MKNRIQDLKDVVESNLNVDVHSITKVDGGLVHYVYRIKTDQGIIFAKIRESHYSALPNITTNPELILYEKKAIEILSKLEPQKFPQLLFYISHKNLLLLSDIMPERTTFEMKLNRYEIREKDCYFLGKNLADIHKKLSFVDVLIREDGDVEFYNQILFYRFGYHKHPAFDEVIDQLKKGQKQPILGDLSPKNIGFSTKRTYTFCDLENFHYGNTVCDTGFLGASIIIHTINNSTLVYKLLLSFLRGYSSISKLNINNLTLKRIVLGIVLYRLDNLVIPYKISITNKARKEKVKAIKKLLYKKKISWKKLVETVTINKL
ncbi:hypothetical protein C4577_02470 [Candidatus Parcubacteria bacterium]|nr:MAG: hypothetical protein C4577_02470 [Candidatus Parcubacteria bacterium]